MEKFYSISFDNVTNGYSAEAIHLNITNLFNRGLILAWWKYLPATYIVKTNLDVNTIYNNIFPSAPLRGLLVIEVDIKNAQGWLPADAWSWLSKGGI